MTSYLVQLTILLQHLSTISTVFERLEYDRISVSMDFQDIVCGLQALDQHGSRGSSFHVNNNTCYALPESWFVSQPSIPDSTIFKLTMREPIFEPAMDVYTDIVPLIVVGSSFVYDIRTGVSNISNFQPVARPLTPSYMTIDVQQDSNYICFHVDIRFSDNTVRFNSYLGYWGWEYLESSPLVLNSGYHLEVKNNVTALEVYINGSLFHEFQHRTTLDNCGVIRCSTDVGICMGLQFFYPV